jgi:CcmD family protein
MNRVFVAFALALMLATISTSGVAAQQPPPQAPPGQNEFVPVKELPQQEQIPAVPLVAAAYGFVWVVLVIYVWSLSRRIGKVQTELTELRKRTARRA